MIAPIDNQTVLVGGSVYFVCNASASESPDVTLQWTREDSLPIMNDDRISTGTVTLGDTSVLQLNISDVGLEQRGTYLCITTNPDGAETAEEATLMLRGKQQS